MQNRQDIAAAKGVAGLYAARAADLMHYAWNLEITEEEYGKFSGTFVATDRTSGLQFEVKVRRINTPEGGRMVLSES